MITVLEGPDMAGKTTLARELGARVVHNGPPPRTVTDLRVHYERQLLACDPREDVVFDRLWLGELAYGPVFRGGSRLSWREHLDLTSLAVQLGARLVHVDSPDWTLLSRYRVAAPGREDLVRREDQLLEIAARYRRLTAGTSWEHLDTSATPATLTGLVTA